MDNKPWLQWMVTVVCIGTVVSPPNLRAAERVTNLVAVRDVALSTDGSLRGSLLSVDGKPQANVDVYLCKGNQVVGQAKTQVDGSFVIRQVLPGVYELASARSANLYRVWSTGSAPPAAQQTALLVQQNTIVRGQGEWPPMRRALILGGVIITSGVLGGVIGYNIKDDDSAS